MAKYRKKPVVIEAIRWTGENKEEILKFCGDTAEIDESMKDPVTNIPLAGLFIHTLEGDHYAAIGDMIIKGVHGEFYPCKPDIFEKTYEEVTDNG